MTDHETTDRYRWQDDAACLGLDVNVFFPLGEQTESETTSQARRICMACPVLIECREWSLAVVPEFGIFGGLTADERRAVRMAACRSRRDRLAAEV